MGDRKTGIIFSMLLVLALAPFVVNDAFALDYKKHVTAEDLGILQLAAHDLFNVDRSIPLDFENGKLDLSTLFVDTTNSDTPFTNGIIAIGGEHRNRENIMLFTVASELGEKYVELVEGGEDQAVAKDMIITLYHEKLADTYQKTFGEEFPQIDDSLKNQEDLHQQNLALRTIHDFLPGKIKFGNGHVSTLDQSLFGEKLNKKELQQKSSKLDGKFDDEFLHIDICLDFPTCSLMVQVNLLEADRSFGEDFETDDSFDDFLEELEDGLYDEDDKVMEHIRTLFAKGQYLD